MFGEGVSLTDLFALLNIIRDKNLQLDVKILNNEWCALSPSVVKDMVITIKEGKILGDSDIRLRLHEKV
jgi:hypothetical protein